MNLDKFKADLAAIEQAIAQVAANHNVLIGQKQGLQHVISSIEGGVAAVSEVTDAVQSVADASKTEPVVNAVLDVAQAVVGVPAESAPSEVSGQ